MVCICCCAVIAFSGAVYKTFIAPQPYEEIYADNVMERALSAYVSAGEQYEMLSDLTECAMNTPESFEGQWFLFENGLQYKGMDIDRSLQDLTHMLETGEVMPWSNRPMDKDACAWIRETHPDMPVVSLDEIRAELRVSPTERQGKVIQTAQERAREYLRNKQPFVWNATNLTRETRGKLTGLFERYGARVRIVYLETDWEERIERNNSRENAVPESVVDQMLGRTVLPAPDEAQTVEWQCV